MFLNLLLQGQTQGGSPYSGLIMMLLIFAIFYFLLFLPMQRQKKKQQQLLKTLEAGQTVLTNGGIVGTIVTVNNDDTLVLRVKPDNIKLQVARSAVAGLISEEAKEAKK